MIGLESPVILSEAALRRSRRTPIAKEDPEFLSPTDLALRRPATNRLSTR